MAIIIKYTYNQQEYRSSYQVRRAIWDEQRKIFGKEPKDGREEFWAELGVVYTQEQVNPSLQQLKQQKLNELDSVFMQWRNDDATMISSLGYEVDSDERAIIDVSGLVDKYSSAEDVCTFMDANNVPHQLSVEQLKIIKNEITTAGELAYTQKWTIRAAIEAAESAEQLNQIQIKFTKQDFTKS